MLINEFLPNPIGKDTEGEWFELFNDGSAQINLRGWVIKDASGKKFTFSKETPVESGAYLKINYSESKIFLNNNGEILFLYDFSGNLVDKVEYQGRAPEGQSLIRQGDKFIFTELPTPGQVNILKTINSALDNSDAGELSNVLISDSYSADATILDAGNSFNLSVFGAGLLICLVLSIFFAVVFQKFDLFSKSD